MPHLLVIDVPGGNDFSLISEAADAGHQITFLTSDIAFYQQQGALTQQALQRISRVINIPGMDEAQTLEQVRALHQTQPIEAVLCLVDIRIILASRLARVLGLPFLNPQSAALLRDKFRVREHLRQFAIQQPDFRLASTPDTFRQAVAEIGYPVVIKPVDGYGSQNVSLITHPDELARFLEHFTAQGTTDYGFGTLARQIYCVEQYIEGAFIGCDIFTTSRQRILLGINDKVMFPAPSFAIRGSCFPSQKYDIDKIKNYAFTLLDKLNFDFGACHIELKVNDDGLFLVEVNPRMVSAQIPFQVSIALKQSMNLALVKLHTGDPMEELATQSPPQFCAIRWFIVQEPGKLTALALPSHFSPAIARIVLFRSPGDRVVPARHNADRIGYVMAAGETQQAAEEEAEAVINQTRIVIEREKD